MNAKNEASKYFWIQGLITKLDKIHHSPDPNLICDHMKPSASLNFDQHGETYSDLL